MTNSDLANLKPVIINRSLYDEVPENLRELGNDIEKIAKEVYHDVLSIDWHGSIPRGDFILGESDADFTIFINGEFEDKHKVKRQKLVDEVIPKWQARGVTKIDLIAIPKSQFHEDFRRNGLFFTESDGIFLPGYPRLDFSYTLPKNNLELVEILNRYFKLWILDAEDNVPELTKEQIYQQVWKRTYRAIYALAILDGAPYEQNWRIYPELIKKHAPAHGSDIEKLLKEGISLDEILAVGNRIVSELEARGLTFKTTW